MLSTISGLGDAIGRVRATFAARLAASAGAAWRALEARGELHPEAEPPDLEMPSAFAEMLAAAIAQEERDGSPRAELLRRHYLDLMPATRVAQLATRAEPNATLLHTRLELARMPRLAGAVGRLDDLLGGASVRARFADAPTTARLHARSYYGGFLPLLYGHAAELAHAARALAERPVHEVLDRYLAAPIVHELSHLGRRRRALLPLYLDECVAGYIGVRALPELAYPAPGDDNGLYAAPWFAQVGQALARVVGVEALVRAHAGAVPWDEVLPPGFAEAALRRGWDDYLARRGPHFLSDAFDPWPWLALLDIRDGRDDDDAIVADALRAMCLDNAIVGGTHRVRTAPPAAPVIVDLGARRVRTRGGAAYWFPPPLAARLQARGIQTIFLRLRDPAQIPRLARVFSVGFPEHGARLPRQPAVAGAGADAAPVVLPPGGVAARGRTRDRARRRLGAVRAGRGRHRRAHRGLRA